SPAARDRKRRGPEGSGADAVLRSGAQGKQGAGQAGRREAFQGEGGRSTDLQLRRQGTAARAFQRFPAELEEGLREAEGRAKSAGLGGGLEHADKKLQ